MLDQKNLRDLPNAISLQESEAGALPSDKRCGMTLDLFGQGVAPASHSASQAKERLKPTTDTSGLTGSGLLPMSALAWSLVNRLRARLPMGGSTMPLMIWKEKVTKRQRLYYQLAVSVHRTGVTDSGLLPTPTTSDATTGAIVGKNDTFYTTKNGTLRKVNQHGTNGSLGLARYLKMLPTPTTSDAKGASANRYNGSPTSHGNLREVLRSSITDGQYPHPRFVAWMMGYPPEHLNFAPTEMR